MTEMQVANDYYVMPTTNGRFVLVIKSASKKIEDPYIVWAKGDHAILYRNKNPQDAVVLDFLAEEVKPLMEKNTRAIVVETENDVPVCDYIAAIKIRDKLPVQLEERQKA